MLYSYVILWTTNSIRIAYFYFSHESSVSRLHERWLKDCSLYRELYEGLGSVKQQPRINWAQVLNQKQVRNTYTHKTEYDHLNSLISHL